MLLFIKTQSTLKEFTDSGLKEKIFFFKSMFIIFVCSMEKFKLLFKELKDSELN